MNFFRSSLLLVGLMQSGTLVLAAPLVLDSSHTSAYFAASHFERSMVRGRFNRIAGQIDFDEAGRSGTVDIRIDPDSIDTGLRALNDVLKSPQFFDTEQFPEIRFQSTGFEFEGERLRAVSGKLSMHGVSLPVQLLANHFKCGEVKVMVLRRHVCGGTFHATVKRSAFGMTRFLPDVGDTVQIDISIEASPANQ
jgi:polyisoprenoid-binding protein YceI